MNKGEGLYSEVDRAYCHTDYTVLSVHGMCGFWNNLEGRAPEGTLNASFRIKQFYNLSP
jgi:hypothetical protein